MGLFASSSSTIFGVYLDRRTFVSDFNICNGLDALCCSASCRFGDMVECDVRWS